MFTLQFKKMSVLPDAVHKTESRNGLQDQIETHALWELGVHLSGDLSSALLEQMRKNNDFKANLSSLKKISRNKRKRPESNKIKQIRHCF